MTETTAILDALPEASLERHVAILGTSDAGKTYAARGEVERLLEAGRRVVIIDPTGVWWGLNFLPDGKTHSPYAPAILGPDVLGAEGAGIKVAESVQVIQPGAAVILDVGRMTVGARTRLFAEFAETLAQLNRQPLHLVIDEAHLFAPQARVHDPMSARMMHAANHLVAGGRALGLRVMMLSQRPAKLHKDSLTQVQTLVAMLNVSPQDRAAVKAWMVDSADPAVGAEILASLAGLPVGEGWIWAPRLEVLSRVKFRPIRTFDSSAAPEHGAAPRRLAPSAPRAPTRAPTIDLEAVAKNAFDEGYKGGDAAGFRRGFEEGWAKGWDGAMSQVREAVERPGARPHRGRKMDGPAVARQQLPPSPKAVTAAVAPESVKAGPTGERLLRALQSSPYEFTTWEDVALLTVLSPVGGWFLRERQALRASAAIIESADGRVRAVEPGEAADPDQLLEAWASKLGGAAARFIPIIWELENTDTAEVCQRLDLSPKGGWALTGFKALRRNRVTVERRGSLMIADLFLDLRHARAKAAA